MPDLVIESLLTDVEQGRISVGETLPPEAELASEFGVSRAVVREALRSLQVQGVVEIVNGVGSVIRPLTATPLATYVDFATRLKDVSTVELLEVRRGVEAEAARLAADRATADDVATLRELVDQMGAAMDDPVRYAELDTAFHLAIARASRNAMLAHLVEAIRLPMRASIERGLDVWAGAGHVDKVQQIHVAILDAIAGGDPARAVAAMDHHFEQVLLIITP
ncbi:FadR/GntR family transcriptional regulator [Jiangella aurantiaca]|uniref:FadR/GntR family transcriptional regulator n=1 Tax=Jiangella aurantiaca TaxID=2530373 RepID=UPI003B834735